MYNPILLLLQQADAKKSIYNVLYRIQIQLYSAAAIPGYARPHPGSAIPGCARPQPGEHREHTRASLGISNTTYVKEDNSHVHTDSIGN